MMRGPTAKPKIRTDATRRLSARLLQDRLDADDRTARTNPHEPLLNKYTVVVIQRHHVRDGSERDEVQVFRGHFGCAVDPLLLQHATDLRHQVERNANPRKVATRKLTALEIRVHHDRGLRQFLAGQVVVGHEYRNTELVRCRRRRLRSILRCRR